MLTIQYTVTKNWLSTHKVGCQFIPFMSCSYNSTVILQDVCISGSEYSFMHVTCYDYVAMSCTTIGSRNVF